MVQCRDSSNRIIQPQSILATTSDVTIGLKVAAIAGDYCIINGSGGGGGGGSYTAGPGLTLSGSQFSVNSGEVLAYVAKVTASLDFTSFSTCQEQTMTVTGAQLTDDLIVTPPTNIEAGLSWTARVTSVNTVTIRLCSHVGSIDPANGATWGIRLVRAF